MEGGKGGIEMIEKLMHRYALSRQGAKDLIKGIVACTLQNISFMLPVTLLYLFVKGLLNKSVKSNTFFFAGGAIICLLVVFCVTLWQYNSTFLATYVETGTRRKVTQNSAFLFRKKRLGRFNKHDYGRLYLS